MQNQQTSSSANIQQQLTLLEEEYTAALNAGASFDRFKELRYKIKQLTEKLRNEQWMENHCSSKNNMQ